jgi:hypothetical protein
MAHNNHVIDGFNKDVGMLDYDTAKDHFLSLAENWEDPNPDPIITEHEGVKVLRDDLITGTKVRGGDLLISKAPSDTIVYVQPRVGLAGVSILDVAKRYDKKVVLFMPSSKKISHHQACCIERGATPIFKRIAAMPNLNKMALDWALENKAFFVPLGLRHELVTAGLVKVASKIPEPEEAYVAISTGVLSRALQIAWPNTKFTCVAVSRNLKAGELGRANVISDPLEFQTEEKQENLPPFPTVNTYDGKVWKYVPKNTDRDIIMWNVGTEPTLSDKSIFDKIDSFRKWDKEL